MSKKIYTEEQVQEKIKEAVEKVYQEQEQREQRRWVDNRISELESKVYRLEREIQELKGEENTKGTLVHPCNCVK